MAIKRSSAGSGLANAGGGSLSEPRSTVPMKRPAGKSKSKRQQIIEQFAPERIHRATSNLMNAMMTDIRQEVGDPTAACLDDLGNRVIGIPAPSLAFEYLTCNTVLPLEIVVQLYGPRGIGKSGLALELMRWFRKLGGIGNYIENESKFNPDWACSIIGWHDGGCLGVVRSSHLEDWESKLQKTLRWVKAKMLGDKTNPGPGKIFPYLQIVDSIMGKPSEETNKKIESQGYAGRSHPVEALSITPFIKMYAGLIANWPVTLVCVNHLKVNQADQGMSKKTRSGGQTIDFQGGFELEVSRTGRIRKANVDGNKLRLVCEKNSFGPDKRNIPVNVLWYDEPIQLPGETEPVWRQKTLWDWDGATVQLILDNQGAGAKWTKAKEITGLVKKTNDTATSRVLGVTEPAENWELGKRIRENPEMLKELRNLFGIRERRIFDNQVDYDKQVADLKRQLERQKARQNVQSAAS